MFFDNLTTSITDMQKYINDHPTLRELPVGFLEFREIVKVHDEKASSKTATRRSAKRGASKNAASVPLVEGNDDDDDSDGIRRSPAQELLHRLRLSQGEFLTQLNHIRGFMKDFPFSNSDRVDPDFGKRVLTTGGLVWNPKTHCPDRDWAPISICATLECALVPLYRPDLLNNKNCEGACYLRKLFMKKLAEKSRALVAQDPKTTHKETVKTWKFADQLEVKEDANRAIPVGFDSSQPSQPSRSSQSSQPSRTSPQLIKPKVYDANAMMHAREVAKQVCGKTKKSQVFQFVENLEKNQYLFCSDTDVPTGTMETLAHFCITVLAEVSFPFKF